MMIRSFFHKAPPYVIEKLKKLYQVLYQEKSRMEWVADASMEQKLKFAMRGLAQECNQNAHEILSQIRIMEGHKIPGVKPEASPALQSGGSSMPFAEKIESSKSGRPIRSKDVLSFYKEEEHKIIQAYREVLNEPFLQNELRSLIRCQFNGVLCTFVQLKLAARVSA